jgi:DNA-directed RNA polymerase subunit RPC12/RpoP
MTTGDHADQPGHLDGNALAGPLSELFAVDVTAATGRCVNCGRSGPIASLRVYSRAPGMVARCPRCDQVILRLVRTPDAAWLDLTGTVSLRVRLPDD